MGKTIVGAIMFSGFVLVLSTVPICRAEGATPAEPSALPGQAGRADSWTDQFGETTYLIAAPDSVGLGDTVHVSITARDPFYPDDLVAAPWSFQVDGTTEDSGFWVSLSDTTWEASYDFVYDSEGGHTYLFTAQDLGHGNGSHSYEWFEIDTTTLVGGATSGIDGQAVDSFGLALSSSWPNPFDVAMTIHCQLHNPTDLQVGIYDATGRLVRRLNQMVEGTVEHHDVHWDGTDDAGRRVRSGVYYCRFQAGEMIRVQRVVLMR